VPGEVDSGWGNQGREAVGRPRSRERKTIGELGNTDIQRSEGASASLPNGSAFSGVRLFGTAPAEAWVHAILP
jgi:hypothetical protein